jgi:hypothetical protein
MSGFHRSTGDRLRRVIDTNRNGSFHFASVKSEKQKRESRAYQDALKLKHILLREKWAQTNQPTQPNLDDQMMDEDNPYNDDYPMDDGVEVRWSESYDKGPNNDTDDDDTAADSQTKGQSADEGSDKIPPSMEFACATRRKGLKTLSDEKNQSPSQHVLDAEKLQQNWETFSRISTSENLIYLASDDQSAGMLTLAIPQPRPRHGRRRIICSATYYPNFLSFNSRGCGASAAGWESERKLANLISISFDYRDRRQGMASCCRKF